MRKLKLQLQLSLDGYIAGPNDEMDWMEWNWDNQLKEYVGAITEAVDCIILGRKLAQGFIPHWASNPEQEGADKMNGTPKVVFTKTLTESKWDNTTLVKGDLIEEITRLKEQNGNDIIAYGGGNFVASLIKHGLIDEYHLFINPTTIGSGMTIFRELDSYQKLTLIKATAFDCGIVALNYKPKRD